MHFSLNIASVSGERSDFAFTSKNSPYKPFRAPFVLAECDCRSRLADGVRLHRSSWQLLVCQDRRIGVENVGGCRRNRRILQSVPQEITFESRQTDGWNIEEAKASAWIVRQGDGSTVAFSPWCTHLGCAYHWESKHSEAAGGCFVCPCHGSRFDANGTVLEGPASRPLDRYATKTQGSRLWILPSIDSQPS